MTNEQLVVYIEDHSHTELALVSNEHVRRFLAIVGMPMPPHLVGVGFISCKYVYIKGLLDRAKQNLKDK